MLSVATFVFLSGHWKCLYVLFLAKMCWKYCSEMFSKSIHVFHSYFGCGSYWIQTANEWMVHDFVSSVINLDCSMLNLTAINQSIKLYLSGCYVQAGYLSKIKYHLSNSYLPIFKKKSTIIADLIEPPTQ